MNQQIITLTKQLISLAEEANAIFDTVRTEGKEKDFYQEVKPFADHVKYVCEQWEQEIKKEMKEVVFKHLYPFQIEQAAGNLKDVAVQAFYPQTSYKRFKSHIQSVLFTLNHVRMECERKIEN